MGVAVASWRHASQRGALRKLLRNAVCFQCPRDADSMLWVSLHAKLVCRLPERWNPIWSTRISLRPGRLLNVRAGWAIHTRTIVVAVQRAGEGLAPQQCLVRITHCFAGRPGDHSLPIVTTFRSTVRTTIGFALRATATTSFSSSPTLFPQQGFGGFPTECDVDSIEARVFRTTLVGIGRPRGGEVQALRFPAHRRMCERHRMPVLPLVRARGEEEAPEGED